MNKEVNAQVGVRTRWPGRSRLMSGTRVSLTKNDKNPAQFASSGVDEMGKKALKCIAMNGTRWCLRCGRFLKRYDQRCIQPIVPQKKRQSTKTPCKCVPINSARGRWIDKSDCLVHSPATAKQRRKL